MLYYLLLGISSSYQGKNNTTKIKQIIKDMGLKGKGMPVNRFLRYAVKFFLTNEEVTSCYPDGQPLYAEGQGIEP
jgi:hypothetical protein